MPFRKIAKGTRLIDELDHDFRVRPTFMSRLDNRSFRAGNTTRLSPVERQRQIGNQIIGMLDADRQTYRRFEHANTLANLDGNA